MTTPLLCLLGFAGWTILLVVLVGAARIVEIVRGNKASNEFPSRVPHGGDRYWRMNRAHLNCVEYLPVFGALVLVAAAAGVPAGALALHSQVVLGARVVQSGAHISSGSVMAVNVRAGMLGVQLVAFVMMGLAILGSTT